MTGGAWIAFGTVEALLAFACVRAWQLWGDRTNAFDTIPAERLRAFPAMMFTSFAWIGLFMLAIALGANAPVLVLSPERVEIGNSHDRREYAWRDVRGLALVKLSPTRPPIVALQLRTGALRRVDALFTLVSVEQKGLAGPLKREGITRT